MNSLELNALGPFRMLSGGQALAGAATDKARALLIFLALEGAQPRTTLTALLWPHLSQDAAFDNLRKTLYRLRQRLDAGVPGTADLLITSRQTMQLDPRRIVVDVLQFQTLLAECDLHAHLALVGCDACLARLAHAVELYRGELLAGFGVGDAPAFEEWLLLRRETLHQQALLALAELTASWGERGDVILAHSYASRSLALDPLREETQRQQMRLLVRLGQRNQALQQYERCRRLLRDELGVEPDPATVALYEKIRRGDLLSPNGESRAAPANRPVAPIQISPTEITNSPTGDEVPETGRVYGRETEFAQLKSWLSEERCQLVAILGIGGIGKTTLAATAVRAVANDFDIVLWRSVINAPPLEEILRDWLNILWDYQLTRLPESLDGRLALLLGSLRKRRCLLVLDNLESIFQPDQAGHLRPEHRAYMQLLQRIAGIQHQSCLLLTSREQPQGFTRLEEDLPWVRMLMLEGLDVRAAQPMFFDRGLRGERRAIVSLIERYSGNPLALKLVAETAQELFGGDIAAFLAADTLIFDDIRDVLDWQFDRLPPLEQEILIWLAVEREPVSIQTLRDNLSPTRPPSELLVAVRSLQRRSLLVRVDVAGPANRLVNGHQPDASQSVFAFALQNVLMEYLIDRLVEAACQEIKEEKLVRLHHHALIKAQDKEYVRQSQVRLILQPIANRLQASLSKESIGSKISRLLAILRSQPALTGGYAAGNLLNLLLLLKIDLTGYDFSHLCMWEADLRGAYLPAVNFAGADLTRSYFSDGFGFVFDAIYSPDGALIAAATGGGEVRVWQAADGRLLRRFTGHRGTVRTVDFSPNGTLLASGGEDNTVRIWNVLESQMHAAETVPFPQVLSGHSGRVTAVAFHPDGNRLASAGVDQTVRLWDLATGKTTAILQGHQNWIWSIAFHPNGATLASAGHDQVIRLWDVEMATERAVLRGHTGAVSTLAFDPRGNRLASGSFDHTVRLWDVESGQTLQILEASMDSLWRVAFSPDASLLATTGDDRMTRIWDLHSDSGNDRILYVLHRHDEIIFALAFSPDGRTLVTGGAGQSVRLWDLPALRSRQIISGHNRSVPMLAYHPNGKLLVSAHYDNMMRLWDLERRAISQSLHVPQRIINAVNISRDGAWLASGGDDLEVWAIDKESRVQRRHLLHPLCGQVLILAFSPNGSILASAGIDQAVSLWDVKSGQLRQTLPGYESPVYSIQFSPDGSLLASGSSDQYIRLWDLHKAHLCHQWRGHANVVHAVAFTPDGQMLASGGGGDGLICVWDIRSPTQPQLRATLRGHTDRVFTIAISADGKYLYSGSADRTIRVWDMQTYQPIRTLHGHTHWVWSLSVSPAGNTLASGSPDETIRLWDIQSGDCLAVLTAPGPYEGMNIRDVRGITEADKTTLKLLGASEQ